MNRNSSTIICLAYGIGLLTTGFFGIANMSPTWQQWVGLILGLSFLSFLSALIIPHLWHKSPKRKLWILAGIVAILAVIYFQLRLPQPTINDISHILKSDYQKQPITVIGKALSEGRITASQKRQFWFEVQHIKTQGLRPVTGKLYVTVPLSEKTAIHAGQKLTIRGNLYRPKAAINPGSFDFKAYLARQGAFAGLKGLEITQQQRSSWGLWQLRQRIVHAQIHGLGSPKGELLSSIVLGRQAVDLSYEIQDLFLKTGLAHVLAASGFHVALLLGVVLQFTRTLSPRYQLTIGIVVLTFYVGLTGIQPSVMRAAVMGIGALIGLVLEKKVNSLGSLLLAGTILLIFNPLWIWDVGFQLSFLATLGLIITVPTLEKYLDWLPKLLASPLAITLAASLWVLPLLMYTFSSVATYNIVINVITSPLITLISLGGMMSAAAALFYPTLGSLIAWFLYYPINFLLAIITFFTHLPGSSFAVGKLPLGIMLLIYTVMILVWLSQKWQRRWWLAGLFIISLIVIPIVYTRLTLTQVTVLATKSEPVVIIQNHGKVVLINGNETETAKYTVLPFLTQQGINKIDSAISLNKATDWLAITPTLPIEQIFSPLNQEKIIVGSIVIEFLSHQIPILQFHTQNQTWLWLTNQEIPTDLTKQTLNAKPLALLWSSKNLNEDWLKLINPQVAIAATSFVNTDTQQQLKQYRIQLYWTGRDGAIQWTPQKRFQTTLELPNNQGLKDTF